MPVSVGVLLLAQAFPIDPDKNQGYQLQAIFIQRLLSGICAKARSRLIGTPES